MSSDLKFETKTLKGHEKGVTPCYSFFRCCIVLSRLFDGIRDSDFLVPVFKTTPVQSSFKVGNEVCYVCCRRL